MTRATVAEARETVLKWCGGIRANGAHPDPDGPLDALIAAVRAEERERVEPLRIFAKKYLDAARGGHDLDFGDVQDAGERLGLLRMEMVREPCGAGCLCQEYDYEGFPMHCYRDTELLAAPTTEGER